MVTYRLTTRGKWVLGIFILLLIVGMVYSGKYIAEYFTSTKSEASDNPDTTIVETTETIETTEISQTSQNPSVETTEHTSEIATEETTEYNETEPTSEAKIYSPIEIEDLKQFKIIFYFNEDQTEPLLNNEEFDALVAAIESYPNESVIIEGHANGYPTYEEDLELEEISSARSDFVKEQLLEAGVDLKNLVITYHGGEKPIKKSYGEQHLNNRVEVYFGNHFIHESIGK